MNNYYIYLHRRLDNYEIFYVGKGKDRRGYSKKSRNLHWHNIVNRVEYKVEILQDTLTELQSLKFEEFWINVFGRRDLEEGSLVNFTNGGEGSSGRPMNEYTKQVLSISNTGRPTSKLQKEVVGARYKGKTGFEHNRSKSVRCLETGVVYGSISEACRENNVDTSTISWAIKNNKKAKGLTFERI